MPILPLGILPEADDEWLRSGDPGNEESGALSDFCATAIVSNKSRKSFLDLKLK